MTYLLATGLALVSLWRTDVFFAAFFSALVLYSSFAQIGYLFFPELSAVGARMYFGPEVFPAASIFTTLSFLALYLGYHIIYRPALGRVRLRAAAQPRKMTLARASPSSSNGKR
jgi:hypothetical protein